MNCSINAVMSNPFLHLLENKLPFNLLSRINQHGNLLMLPLIVIIILTLLGNFFMRMISTSSETTIQAELQLLFPLNAIHVDSYDFQTGLIVDIPRTYDHEAFTTFDNFYSDTENPLVAVRYNCLTTTGDCGSGTNEANSKVVIKNSCSIQVKVRSL